MPTYLKGSRVARVCRLSMHARGTAEHGPVEASSLLSLSLSLSFLLAGRGYNTVTRFFAATLFSYTRPCTWVRGAYIDDGPKTSGQIKKIERGYFVRSRERKTETPLRRETAKRHFIAPRTKFACRPFPLPSLSSRPKKGE